MKIAMGALMGLCAWVLCGGMASAAVPKLTGPVATSVTGTSVTLKGSVNPEGQETTWRFSFGTADCSIKPNPCKFTGKKAAGSGIGPVPVSTAFSGLAPGTVYHFLLEAENAGGKVLSTDRAFATQGTPSEGLPDERVYEQASPIDKDGGDAVGVPALVKAAGNGSGISFGNTFGIPGGKGAQALPSYLALRGTGESGWATQGLLPPENLGERAQVQGWLPDFSETFSNVAKLGNPRKKALVLQSTAGGPSVIVSPYTQEAEYSYVGATPDASKVFFESEAKLKTHEGGPVIEGAIQGAHNLYVWNRTTGELGLAGALNDGKAPPKGAFAGPYDWSRGINATSLRGGGAARDYYLQGTHAITASGDVYFTEAGTGHLYLRVNPAQPQSQLDGTGQCVKPADACTIAVSASKRTIPDPAGSQPAAFQAASADGSKAFFTSPEKLTDNANTGPEQPKAAIGEGSGSTGAIEDPALVEKHAIGVVVSGSNLYWANPTTGTIERSDLDGSHPEEFIDSGTGECEVELEVEKEVFAVQKVEIPNSPRYVALDPTGKFIYWTNTGLSETGGEGKQIDGGGTIGRAEIGAGGEAVNIDPAFICGEVEVGPGEREDVVSNPQGIAANEGHIYWANAAAQNHVKRSIAQAKADGSDVEAEFITLVTPGFSPAGIALSDSHIYFSSNEPGSDFAYVERATLEGTKLEKLFIGKAGIQGVALNATDIYWASQSENAIGRVPISDFETGACVAIPSCEIEFVKPAGRLNGLAANAEHLYWSVNGEAPTNPGNDLYRFEPGTNTLEDLTPLSEGNGAEVQGVLAVSDDGSSVYFAANGILDTAGKAKAGNCQASQRHGSITPMTGSCNIYLYRQGTITLVGRVRGTDAQDWTGTPQGLFSSFAPKTAFLSSDGQTLLFRSQEQLSSYGNEGVPELYRYSAETGKLACVSCPPSGEEVGKGFSLGSVSFPEPLSPVIASVAMVASRNFSSDGNRAFFETSEALVPGDTNGSGQAKCPGIGAELTPACLDTYEWEAPGVGSCEEGGTDYSPLNEGCIYLVSTGKSPYPSYFADASENGNDVFFFTRQQLVGQDKDELQDVYDARVGGGLASQNEVPPVPCEATDACHGQLQTPPAEATPTTPQFVGPGNAVPKHKAQKKKKHKAKKHKAKKKHKGKRANAIGRTGR